MIGELFRFGLVGIAGLAVDLAVLYGFLALAGPHLLIGQALAWLAGATSTWALNRRFTFAPMPGHPLRQWATFLVVNSAGGAVNYAVYTAMVQCIAFCHTYPFLAVGAGAIAGLGFNFAGSRRVVFTARPDQSGE